MFAVNRAEYSKGEKEDEKQDGDDAESSDSTEDVRGLGREIGPVAFVTTCCYSMFGSEQRAPGHLEALGFFRFFAAVHIFAEHYCGMMHGFNALITWDQPITLWGSSWVTFFFVLSGFTLTYSQLKKTDPMEMPHFRSFMWRRWMSVYPLYAIFLLLKGPGVFDGPAQAVTGKLILGHGCTAHDWGKWLAHILLVQSWTDGLFGGRFPWLYEFDPSWFLSSLNLFWILWYLAFPRIYKLPQAYTWLILGILLLIHSIIPLVIYVWCGGLVPLWAMNIFLWPSAFSPLKSVWKFFCGIFLAKLFMTSRSDSTSNVFFDKEEDLYELSASEAYETLSTTSTITGRQPRYTTYYGCMGWMVLLSAFAFGGQGLRDLAAAGGFMPVTLLFIWGLANGDEDLLGRCIGRRPFCWGDILAYGIYILHPCIWGFVLPIFASAPSIKAEYAAKPAEGFIILLALLLVFVTIAEYGFARPVQHVLK